MKKATLLIIAFAILIVGLVSFAGLNNSHFKGPAHHLINSPWESDGNSITVTEVVVVDSYSAPDGAEYTAVTDGKLLLVQCKVDLAAGWSIKKSISISNAFHSVNLLCDPIQEADADKELWTLLFSLPADAYSGKIDYGMMLILQCGDQVREAWFTFLQ